jgi:hypothetical protein
MAWVVLVTAKPKALRYHIIYDISKVLVVSVTNLSGTVTQSVTWPCSGENTPARLARQIMHSPELLHAIVRNTSISTAKRNHLKVKTKGYIN